MYVFSHFILCLSPSFLYSPLCTCCVVYPSLIIPLIYIFVYNGLCRIVGNEWEIKKNLIVCYSTASSRYAYPRQANVTMCGSPMFQPAPEEYNTCPEEQQCGTSVIPLVNYFHYNRMKTMLTLWTVPLNSPSTPLLIFYTTHSG